MSDDADVSVDGEIDSQLARKDLARTEIIVPDAAHGTNPATATMCGSKVSSSSRTFFWMPLITLITTTSAPTPSITPITQKSVIAEMAERFGLR